jgi:hypothetical protein
MIRNKSKNPSTINMIFSNKNVSKNNISLATKFKNKSNHIYRCCTRVPKLLADCLPLSLRTHSCNAVHAALVSNKCQQFTIASLQCSCAGPRSGLIGNADTHAHDIYGCIIALWQACHSHALLVFQTPGPLAQVCSHQRVPSHMSHSHVLIQASSAVQTLRV